MKKLSLITIITIVFCLNISANNIEAIYGKNDINLNNSFANLFGNNFGNILAFDNLQPHYVDISNTNTKIETLDDDNKSFVAETATYQSEIDSHFQQKSEIADLISKIDLLLIDLISTSAELYTVKNSLSDKEMLQKIQTSIEENRQQIYDLNNRKTALFSSLEELQTRIIANEKFVTVNNLYIRRNTRRIDYLNECIQYSDRDTSSLYDAVSRSTSYQSEVDTLLNVSF